MKHSLYLCGISETKLKISIISFVFYLLLIRVCETFQNISNCHVFSILFLSFYIILQYLAKLMGFGSNGIQIGRFLHYTNNFMFFSVFSIISSKKEPTSIRKLNKKTNEICSAFKVSMISMSIITLLLILILGILEKIVEPKQQKEGFFTESNFLFAKSNYPLIVPLLWSKNNFILSDGMGCENESINQGRSYVNSNIDVSNCFFSRLLTYSEDGGVIYVSVSSCSMNLNYSMFYNCVCSLWGGAICFNSTNSNLKMICANSCSASLYHFAYLEASNMNQMEYLSITNCSHNTSGYYPIRIVNGYQRVDNTNSSMNNAFYCSCIGVWLSSSFTSSHCTFSNNIVNQSLCIGFWYYSGTMLFVNIINNNSPAHGVIHFDKGSMKFHYCIFYKNQNILLNLYIGSLELSHCFISHEGSFSIGTATFSSNNNSLTFIMTYQIQFFNSHHCNADIPLLQRSMERTLDETIARTYDLECEMNNLLSYAVLRKSNMNMFPIFISLAIVK